MKGLIMKKIIATSVFVIALLAGTYSAFAQDTYVRGHYRRDGTYVQPHYRSAPDGNPYNNWSTRGNVNPYTGAVGTRNVEPSNSFGSSGSSYNSGHSGYRPLLGSPSGGYGSSLLGEQ
jgi:hypothetical protein